MSGWHELLPAYEAALAAERAYDAQHIDPVYDRSRDLPEG